MRAESTGGTREAGGLGAGSGIAHLASEPGDKGNLDLQSIVDLIVSCDDMLAETGVVTGEEDMHHPGSNHVNLANSQTDSSSMNPQCPTVPIRDTSDSVPACPGSEPVADSDPMREDLNSVHASPSSEFMAASGPTST